ncbi:hypothetical protein AAHH84_00090 [Candidatus Hodgkinia cicadicola]
MKLAFGGVVNRSVDFSFYLGWLFLVGCDVERVMARTCFGVGGFGKIKAVFKARRVSARGCYFLVKLGSGAKVVYGSHILKIGDVVLFAPYGAYTPRYSRSFGPALVWGVKCDGFVCTPYDLCLSSCCFRPVFARLVSQVVGRFGDWGRACVVKPALNRSNLVWVGDLSCALSSSTNWHIEQIKLERAVSFEGAVGLFNTSQDVFCFRASFCVFKDSFSLLKWFASTDNVIENSVRDFFVYASSAWGVNVNFCPVEANVRVSVLNERLLLWKGYVRLVDEVVVAWGNHVVSILGRLDFGTALDIRPSGSLLFFVKASWRLKVSAIKRALSAFVLDSSALIYVKLRRLGLKARHLFVNFVLLKSKPCSRQLFKRFGLLRRVGASLVKIGPFLFLKLPFWRLDVCGFCDVLGECLRLGGLKPPERFKLEDSGLASKPCCFDVFMSARRCLSGFGFVEVRTSSFVNAKKAKPAELESCVEIYGKKKESLFVRRTLLPCLTNFYFKGCRLFWGVYELGKVNVGSELVNALCLIGDERVLAHLFWSFRYVFAWPLVAEATTTSPSGWLVYDSSSKLVGACGQLASNRWYFEATWIQTLDPNRLRANGCCVHVANAVVKLLDKQKLRLLVFGFQRYVSALCAVSVSQVCELATSSLIALKLKLRSFNLATLPKLFSAFEAFASEHEAELVWTC